MTSKRVLWVYLWLMSLPLSSRRGACHTCKGTSVCFLTSPILSHSPPVNMYSPFPLLYQFQGPHLKLTTSRPDGPMTLQKLTHRLLLTPHLSLLFVPQLHQMSLGRIGTGLRDTMAPSAITWTPIYGRLGDKRLGTVIPCISFVD
jgi:hypothetical protein